MFKKKIPEFGFRKLVLPEFGSLGNWFSGKRNVLVLQSRVISAKAMASRACIFMWSELWRVLFPPLVYERVGSFIFPNDTDEK